MIKRKIIVFRHGQTDWNLKKICLGSKHDIPLNNNGLSQARELANKLKEEPIEMFFTSPLVRAIQTAEIVNKFHKVRMLKVNDLKEIDYGDASGMKKSEAVIKYSNIFNNWMAEDFHSSRNMRIPNGESKEEFFNRVNGAFLSIVKENEFSCAAVASHSGVIWNFIRYSIGKDVKTVNHCTAYSIFYNQNNESFTIEKP